MPATKLTTRSGWIPGQRKALALMSQGQHRGILIPGPRGNGKTAAAVLCILKRITLARGQRFGIVGVSAASARSNVEPLLRRAFREMGWAARYGDIEGKRGIEVKGTQILFYAGAKQSDEYVMQGQTWELAYLDELSNLTPNVWNMIQGNLRGHTGGPPFLIATFNKRGPRHWTKTQLRDRADELGLAIIEWPITENTHLPPEFLDRLLLLEGAAFQRYVLNLDADEEGLVYSGWQEATASEIAIAQSNLAQHGAVGVDYGPQAATAAVWLAPVWDYNTETYIALAEYHHIGYRDPMHHATAIADRAPSSYYRRRAWCDYAPNRALASALTGIGLRVRNPYKKDKLKSITHLQQALRRGTLKIAPQCHHLITELESVIWKAEVVADQLDPSVPNDVTDALEYVTSGIIPIQDGIVKEQAVW